MVAQNQGRHGGLPLQGYVPMNIEGRSETCFYKGFFNFRNPNFEFRIPDRGQAQGPAPTKDFSFPKSEFRTPNSRLPSCDCPKTQGLPRGYDPPPERREDGEKRTSTLIALIMLGVTRLTWSALCGRIRDGKGGKMDLFDSEMSFRG